MPDRRHPDFPGPHGHALRNVAGLMVDGEITARLPVKAHFGLLADFLDGSRTTFGRSAPTLGADFTGDDGHAGRHEVRKPRESGSCSINVSRMASEIGRQPYRMTFGHGLGRKEISAFFGLRYG